MKQMLFLIVFFLTGCAHFNKEFECPPSQGKKCQRLSTINQEYNTEKATTYIKNDRYDVYFEGYEDEKGIYHHARKVTINAS